MHHVRSLPRPSLPATGRRGFTLIELLLVTVVLGILATIVSPYFAQAREQAIMARIQADVRQLMDGVEIFAQMNDGRWPVSLTEVETGGSYVSSRDVEYCLFISVPEGPASDPYVMAIAGHRGTTGKILILYPRWGSRMLEFDDGQRGC